MKGIWGFNYTSKSKMKTI